jgi:glycosyltransferase involved in cell wall biosynthesis
LPPGIIIIPALDEEPRIADVLSSIRSCGLAEEVLVIDDGSRDETPVVAQRMGARVISHAFNLGYGAALQTGYKYALRNGYHYLVQMDADGQHHASDIATLRDKLLQGSCDIVIGSRFISDTEYKAGTTRRIGRGLLYWLGHLSGLEIADPTSGFQALNRDAIELFCDDYFPVDFPDIDVLLFAQRRGLRILEVSVQMAPSVKVSSLHSGFKPFYYAYKMLLSLWVSSTEKRRARDGPQDL